MPSMMMAGKLAHRRDDPLPRYLPDFMRDLI
jgi:hypothetical protein